MQVWAVMVYQYSKLNSTKFQWLVITHIKKRKKERKKQTKTQTQQRNSKPIFAKAKFIQKKLLIKKMTKNRDQHSKREIPRISNDMFYTMLYMLEWMRKGNHRIGTSRTAWFSLVDLRPQWNPLRATFLLCKSVV